MKLGTTGTTIVVLLMTTPITYDASKNAKKSELGEGLREVSLFGGM